MKIKNSVYGIILSLSLLAGSAWACEGMTHDKRGGCEKCAAEKGCKHKKGKHCDGKRAAAKAEGESCPHHKANAADAADEAASEKPAPENK